MKIENRIAALLAAGIISTSSVAGGMHHDEHKSSAKSHASTSTESHSGMEHMHGKEKGHEGSSPVGKPSMSKKAHRTINVTTLDSMRFEFSDDLGFRDGEVVNFVVTNKGKIPHEFSIGDADEQTKHREMMRKMPGMVHSDGNTITIPPGQMQQITWEFKGKSEVVFACNIPGHFEAGMRADAIVQNSGHYQDKPIR